LTAPPISLADCLAQAARLTGNSQDPAYVWAVREGVARLGQLSPYVLRRTLKDRTCVVCGLSMPRLQYVVSQPIREGTPFSYAGHLCIPDAAKDLLPRGVPDMPCVIATHWDPARGEAVNLELDAAGMALVELRRAQRAADETAQREALALLVWSMSTVEAAGLLNISDVALAKRCRKHAVPKPPRGFWQKVIEEHPVDDLIPPAVGPLLARFGWHGDYYDWLDNLPWDDQTGSEDVLAALRKMMGERRF